MNNGTFQIKSWEEKPYKELDGGFKMSAAHIKQSYEGLLQGESIVEYLMTYCRDGNARFVGHEFFSGQIGDRSGSVVFQHNGIFEAGEAKSDWHIVEGTGSEGMEGLKGSGNYSAKHGGTASYAFNSK